MGAFTKQFKELWELGGPIAAVMGIASILFIEEGVRFLYYGELSGKIAAAEIDNTLPFFIQGYGLLALGLILLIICLFFFYKMKTLELLKDTASISALRSTTKTVCQLLEKADSGALAGHLNLVQQTVDQGNSLLEKLIRKNYTQ